MTSQDITPDGSAAPVFLDESPRPPTSDAADLEALMAERAASRESALAKLTALGLTDDEANALVD